MFTDILGKKRAKAGLHIHTSRSDGRVSPEESLIIHRDAGYDVVALTDHWHWSESGAADGVTVISGAEYNIGGQNSTDGVYHILGLGCTADPQVKETDAPQTIIDKIRANSGIAVLAHPAWSLNSPAEVEKLSGFSATEIYNTTSEFYANNRPYSGNVVDLLANDGYILPLIATDDTHFYGDDKTVSSIMIDVTDGKTEVGDLIKKVADGDFYATQGPEIHLSVEDGKAVVRCSPVTYITFYSQCIWSPDRNLRGYDLTYAEYKLHPFERWIRAEVCDAHGRFAWSNIIRI